MLATLNDRLFLALNASASPNAAAVLVADVAATWLVYAVLLLLPALWVWGRRDRRGGFLVTGLAVVAALAANQLLGLLWYEPRPFMAHIGHTLMAHAIDNSFPSDHATFMWSLGFGLIATSAARRWGAAIALLGFLVAWARVYLGLHFPLDMAASFAVGLVAAAAARGMRPLVERWLLPFVEHLYKVSLGVFHLPPAVFPR